MLQGALLYPAPQGKPAPPLGFEEIKLVAEDGVQTRAFYRKARAGMPTVLYYHGNGETLSGSLTGTRHLAEAGYGLLLPEYRGYGGQSGTPGEAGFYADGRAALEWLSAQAISADQTIISGYSIGSGTAVQMAVEREPAALILNAPFRSLTGLVSDKFPWLPVSLLLRDRFDSEAKLANFGKPVLMTHGERDTLIPPSNTLSLSKVIKDHEYHWFADLGHNDMYHNAVLERQLEWLERKGLGPKGSRAVR
jgi:fermentation-respiration switch protein FrsA (DUF1100 family)